MSMSRTIALGWAMAGAAFASDPRFLSPAQDINLMASESATNPLEWLGANSPWFAGPNLFGISSEVPDNCYVEQAAYVTRHGSRFPDSGAYAGWVAMQNRFQPSNGYTATGSLAFMPSWKTVLTNPSLQIAMESPTGAKEAQDLGYTLRTRYPDLYNEGDDFIVWANNYTRVIQTAQMFLQGYLGFNSANTGSVVSVTSKGFNGAIGNSLSPSDQCPNFSDASGGANKTTWDNIWVPPVMDRLQSLITGNLTLTSDDVQQIPYLCGFESQITGRMSPWCDVFTDDELKSYEYSNDLRYWYGVGPGEDLPIKMMTPFLNTLVGILNQGPGVTGTDSDGSTFELPKLLMSFLNDGQMSELASVIGVFDDQEELPPTERPDDRLFMASRFVTMRGTIAFERLNCIVSGEEESSSSSSASRSTTGSSSSKPSSASFSSSSWGFNGSSTWHPTTLSSVTRSGKLSSTGASGSGQGSATTTVPTAGTSATSGSAGAPGGPGHSGTPSSPGGPGESSGPGQSTGGSGGSETTGAHGGGGGGEVDLTTVLVTKTTTYCPTPAPTHVQHSRRSTNATFVRIRLNDAVYPLPSCKNGPGSSCLMSDYADYISKKYAAQGDWITNCNVTTAGAPTTVQGASFFTDLSSPWLQKVAP